nr:hypothetical protein [Tanacetum cinerariifolium]
MYAQVDYHMGALHGKLSALVNLLRQRARRLEVLILRNRLKYTFTYREVQSILMTSSVEYLVEQADLYPGEEFDPALI